ncbi:pepsin/retropepsin-like aspartic protease family protein [Sphingomonas sp. HITSZ_GF]|uniref:pepsin/retropepsin-like aspartic protease family protein n=1 Tax=Sphingomonas sp. HITSZ_GF TaxID=3037247 RepID=UPI00240D4480|nr:pepsin/retropepsin-like aspartic protease family protein [Sphingomonas sp. HITSZ_GF]MDG2534822.1 pepsin/retropepsin-like aspartic protease family protein [Sphingomonas sp. HITSZ_GF]
MSRSFTSLCRPGAALLLAALALGPAAIAVAQDRDVSTLIDEAPAGEIAPLEAALAAARDKGTASLLRARIAALRLDRPATDAALEAFDRSGDRTPLHRAAALSIRADLAFAEGDYAAAAEAIDALAPLLEANGKADAANEARRTLSVAALLAAVPRQGVAGGVPVATLTARDKAGLVRAEVRVNGTAQDAVLDTGANLSVVTASTAKRLGLKMLEGEASVVSTGSAKVPTRLAIAERLVIAGIELHDVVFLVFDDAALSFPIPGGYQIDAIIGFPVFRALGRVRFDRAGSFTPGGAAAPGAANLRSTGNDLYVAARINDAAATLHLDTGASATALTSRFAGDHAALVATLPRGARNIAGAGGVIQQPIAWWRPATVAIDGRTTTLPQVQLVLTPGPTGREANTGTIGQDVLHAFEWWAVDFRAMRFEFGPPVTATP